MQILLVETTIWGSCVYMLEPVSDCLAADAENIDSAIEHAEGYYKDRDLDPDVVLFVEINESDLDAWCDIPDLEVASIAK